MLNETKEALRIVRCYHSANDLELMVQRAKDNDSSYLDFLNELLARELENRQKNRLKRNLKQAGFPCTKTIDEFDFKFQTTIHKKHVNEWLDFE